MAKTKTDSEVTVVEPAETGVATMNAQDFGGGLVVQGLDDTTPQLSRVVLFQGTAEEEQMYGEHKRGVFLDALESRELGNEIRIMPISAWASWAKFVKGSSRPEYSHTNMADVPPADLEWGEDGTPPAATESINLIVAVEGEPWPYLLVFKRTGLKSFNKTIKPIEARRASTGKMPGLYLLGSVDDTSADGKPFKRMTCRSLGDPGQDVAQLAKQVFDALGSYKQQAEQMADAHDEAGDPETPPF